MKKKMPILKKLINLVKMSLKNIVSKVLVEGKVSKPFKVNLFNLIENILREINVRIDGIVYYSKHQIIAYTDKIAIITKSKRELERLFGLLEGKSERYRLLLINKKQSIWT